MRSNIVQQLIERLNRLQKNKNAQLSWLDAVSLGGDLQAQRFRMGNGLTIVHMYDPSAPVVSYQSWYRVGSRHEQPSKTGLAHFFEHLMFNETKTLAAGQFDRLMESAGAQTNAGTWVDWTYYYETLPRQHIELAVRIEAGRMSDLVLRKPQITSEIEVVANERRFRIEDDVQGAVTERLFAESFKKHSYRWPTIGWMKHIEAYNAQDCAAFYRKYYAPNNAVVVMVGDIQSDEALSLLQTYYGAKKPSVLTRERMTIEPALKEEKRVVMKQPTQTEKFQLGYRIPGFSDPDHVALNVAEELLFGGRSARALKKMVFEDELASEVRGSLTPFEQPGLFEVWVSMRPTSTAKQGLKVFDKLIEELGTKKIDKKELDKVKNKTELSFLHGLETANGKAENLGFYEVVTGHCANMYQRIEALRAVTPTQVQSAVKKYLKPSNRTVIEVMPNAKS